MKKLISALLSALLLISAVPFVYAADNTDSSDSDGKVYQLIPDVDKYYSEASDYIVEQLRDFKTTIDLSEYQIHINDIIDVYKSAVFTAPDIFYVDASSINYRYNIKTNAIETITPVYIVDRDKLKSYVKKFNNAADALLKDVDPSWSEYKKALIIHDRIVASSKYKKVNLLSYTAYGILVNKKGNCEAYSRAYSYLLSKVGIDTKPINLASASHLWCVVKIGGKWYHTDVTADDQVPDTDGLVSHKFFLVSDSKLKSYKSDIHQGIKNDISYSSEFKCSSDTYDKAFFRSVKSQFVIRGENLYYIKDFYKNGCAALLRRKDGSVKALFTVPTRWYNTEGSVYLANYSRLCEYGNYLFFNSSRCIYRYNLKTGKTKKVFSMPSFRNKDLYGVRLSGSYIMASLKKDILQTGTDRKLIKVNGSKTLSLPFLRYSSVTLKVKQKYDLKVYKGSGKIKFKSSAPKVAKISSKGRITALKKGKATITVVRNSIKMKCKINVVK